MINPRIEQQIQDAWTVARKLKGFTLSEVMVALPHFKERKLIQMYGLLESKGYISVDRTTKPYFYILREDAGEKCPDVVPKIPNQHPTTGDRVWASIKVLKKFTLKDVTLVAESSDHAVHIYFLLLKKGGYIKDTPEREKKTFVFVTEKNTGPLSPVYTLNGDVYDRNLREIVWHREVKSA